VQPEPELEVVSGRAAAAKKWNDDVIEQEVTKHVVGVLRKNRETVGKLADAESVAVPFSVELLREIARKARTDDTLPSDVTLRVRFSMVLRNRCGFKTREKGDKLFVMLTAEQARKLLDEAA